MSAEISFSVVSQYCLSNRCTMSLRCNKKRTLLKHHPVWSCPRDYSFDSNRSPIFHAKIAIRRYCNGSWIIVAITPSVPVCRPDGLHDWTNASRTSWRLIHDPTSAMSIRCVLFIGETQHAIAWGILRITPIAWFTAPRAIFGADGLREIRDIHAFYEYLRRLHSV